MGAIGRGLVLTGLLGLCVGFETIGSRWAITPSEPTLWVRLCDRTIQFPGAAFEVGDPLHDSGYTDIVNITASILEDYNSIPGSFLRLALYPTDPENPPPAKEGDTPFTTAKSADHVIDVCFNGTGVGGLAGGLAYSKFSGNTLVGCEVKLADSVKGSVEGYVGTLTHEIGHCLGLDHPQESTHALMSYYSKGYRLQNDDRMGISFLYPDPEQYEGQSKAEKYTFGMACKPG